MLTPGTPALARPAEKRWASRGLVNGYQYVTAVIVSGSRNAVLPAPVLALHRRVQATRVGVAAHLAVGGQQQPLRPVVVGVHGDRPLQRNHRLAGPIGGELRQAALIEIARRVVRVQSHRPVDSVQRLVRPPREAQCAGERDVAVGVVGIAVDRTFRLGDGLVVPLRLQLHRARDLVRERRRLAHRLGQILLGAVERILVSRPELHRRSPEASKALPIDRRESRIRPAVVRIELDGLLEVDDRGAEVLRRLALVALPAFQEDVVGLGVARAPDRDAIALVLRQLDGQCLDDVARHRVLQAEDVLQVAVVAVGPDMAAARGVDELGVDADVALRSCARCPRDVANAERLGDLAHVARLALVGEGRVAGDDEQAASSTGR